MKKARLELEAGRFELANSALLGHVVFHAQQGAERSLKAFLAWHDVPFRKTHDLGAIGGACLEFDPSLRQVVDRAAPPYTVRLEVPLSRGVRWAHP